MATKDAAVAAKDNTVMARDQRISQVCGMVTGLQNAVMMARNDLNTQQGNIRTLQGMVATLLWEKSALDGSMGLQKAKVACFKAMEIELRQTICNLNGKANMAETLAAGQASKFQP